MRVLIRADAGSVPEIGTGHIIRSIKLADALRISTDFQYSEILFATRKHPPFGIGGKLVKQAGYKTLNYSDLTPNSKSELFCLINAKPDIIIFDRLETSADLVLDLKKLGITVITFDDLGEGSFYADLAINPLLQETSIRHNSFIGFEYIFPLPFRISSREIRNLASRIFVSFGGFDCRQLNAFFINIISKIHIPMRYDVIVGDLDSRNLNTLTNLASTICKQSNVEIVLHQRPSDFYTLLCDTDLAIVSGGLTAFACAQCGVPAIGIPQYEHQLKNLIRLKESGCLKLGTHKMELDEHLLYNLVNELITDQTERMIMQKNGRKIIDGKGLERTMKLISSVVKYSSSPLKL